MSDRSRDDLMPVCCRASTRAPAVDNRAGLVLEAKRILERSVRVVIEHHPRDVEAMEREPAGGRVRDAKGREMTT